jgi:hypothetical protein
VVVVERTAAHSAPAHWQAVVFGRLSQRHGGLDGFKLGHWILLDLQRSMVREHPFLRIAVLLKNFSP